MYLKHNIWDTLYETLYKNFVQYFVQDFVQYFVQDFVRDFVRDYKWLEILGFTVNLFTGITKPCEIIENSFFRVCFCFFLHVSMFSVNGIWLEST